MMNTWRLSAAYLAAIIYTTTSLLAAGGFLAATTLGSYTWVARLGGAGWVFLLSMIILMPTVTPWTKNRLEEGISMRPFRRKAKGKDLVCGMIVDPMKAAASIYQRITYHFCFR